jgi:hypothetical protein
LLDFIMRADPFNGLSSLGVEVSTGGEGVLLVDHIGIPFTGVIHSSICGGAILTAGLRTMLCIAVMLVALGSACLDFVLVKGQLGVQVLEAGEKAVKVGSMGRRQVGARSRARAGGCSSTRASIITAGSIWTVVVMATARVSWLRPGNKSGLGSVVSIVGRYTAKDGDRCHHAIVIRWLGRFRRRGIQVHRREVDGDCSEGKGNVWFCKTDDLINSKRKIVADSGRDRVNIATDTIEKLRHKIRVVLQGRFVVKNVLNRLEPSWRALYWRRAV